MVINCFHYFLKLVSACMKSFYAFSIMSVSTVSSNQSLTECPGRASCLEQHPPTSCSWTVECISTNHSMQQSPHWSKRTAFTHNIQYYHLPTKNSHLPINNLLQSTDSKCTAFHFVTIFMYILYISEMALLDGMHSENGNWWFKNID